MCGACDRADSGVLQLIPLRTSGRGCAAVWFEPSGKPQCEGLGWWFNHNESERTMSEKIEYAVLVYQAGIANVFAVDCLNMSPLGRNARRLLQHAFGPCEDFARGLAAAGVPVASAWCNQAGDIKDAKWNEHDLDEAPFSDSMHPVWSGVANPDSLTVEAAPGDIRYVF